MTSSVEVLYSRAFKRQLKKLSRQYRRIKSDLTPVVDALLAGETPGDQLSGCSHRLFKVRAPNSDSQRGKSGGYRIIYYVKTETHCILVTVYSKSDQDDIDNTALKQLMDEIDRELPSAG